jgi:tight adherence protein B
VAAELRAGRALRVALVEAAARSGLDLKETIRLALAGRPMPEVAHSLQRHLEDGRTVALAVKVASATGGRVSEVFDRLAVLAAEAEAMRRERRALSAQARLSSLIVGGFPLVYLLWQLLGGGWARLVASGPLGRASLVLGLVLLGLGAVAVALMLLRAER